MKVDEFHFYKILLKKRKKANFGWGKETRLIEKHGSVLSIDEAGRGPLAGPLSVGGLFLDKNILRILKNNKIEFYDSKKFSETERNFIYKTMKYLGLPHKTFLIPHKTIEKQGINKAFIIGAQKLAEYFQPKSIVFDGRRVLADFKQKCYFFVKGDQKLNSLGAASIAAKVKRDKHITNLAKKYPLYKFEQHKGYGTKLHIKLIKRYGLSDIHRKSFCKNFTTKNSDYQY